jgi:hypothetical protein
MEWMGVAMVRWVAMGGGAVDPVGKLFEILDLVKITLDLVEFG